MADRIETFDVTIPNGTQPSTPITIATSFTEGIVDEIEVKIPSGPRGLMGFRFAYGSQGIIPHDDSKWIITDNEPLRWPVNRYPTGSHWNVIGYNTGIFDHTIRVRYLITEVLYGSGASNLVKVTAAPSEIVLASSGS